MLLIVLTVVGAAFALAQVVFCRWISRAVPVLSTVDAPTPAKWPRLSIVVPARNESFGVEGALRSKLACGYPDIEVIVVDDRSTDATGRIAAELAAKDPRLQVARIDALPDGWLGKLHAMSVGVEKATGEWLLLSDADVHIEAGTLERVIAHAEAHAVDMVALLPRMEPVSPVVDACVSGLIRTTCLGGRAWQANDDRSGVGLGVGAFNLVRRSALQRSPGLAHLRMEMADDIALGAMMKASGARCRFFASRAAVHLVFAERLSVLARNAEKGGCLFGFSLVRTMLVAAFWLALDLGIPLAGLAAGGLPALAGAIQLVLLTATHLWTARHFGAPIRGALLWPVGVVMGIAILARSGGLAWWRKAIVWRGTYYGQREIEAGRRWFGGRMRLET